MTTNIKVYSYTETDNPKNEVPRRLMKYDMIYYNGSFRMGELDKWSLESDLHFSERDANALLTLLSEMKQDGVF